MAWGATIVNKSPPPSLIHYNNYSLPWNLDNSVYSILALSLNQLYTLMMQQYSLPMVQYIPFYWFILICIYHFYSVFLIGLLFLFFYSFCGRFGSWWAVTYLSSGWCSAADYVHAFRTFGAQTVWVDDTLKVLFRKGLNPEMQLELACRDEGRNLHQFIDLDIRIDNLVHTRRPRRPSPALNSSPVEEQESM